VPDELVLFAGLIARWRQAGQESLELWLLNDERVRHNPPRATPGMTIVKERCSFLDAGVRASRQTGDETQFVW